MPPKPQPGPKSRTKGISCPSDSADMFESMDDLSGAPPPGKQIRRSDSEGEASKRFRADASADVVAAVSAPEVLCVDERCPTPEKKKMKHSSRDAHGVTLKSLRKLDRVLRERLCDVSVPAKVVSELLDIASGYTDMVQELLLENAGLRGRIGGLEANRCVHALKSAVPVSAAAPVVGHAMVPDVSVMPMMPEPMETYAARLKSNDGATSRQIIDKVNKEVGPSLGVRVAALQPTRDGGALIRTPSKLERDKVVRNEKFGEVGLQVTADDKLGPRVVVGGVRADIEPKVFMEHLYTMNLEKKFSAEMVEKSIRMVTKPWKVDSNSRVNVVLEGTDGVIKEILRVGKVFVEWYSFRAYLQDPVQHCFRCLSFDHRVRDCRIKGDVCRLCGQVGHLANHCSNPIRCRNCAREGRPADHPMLSYVCPIYAGLVARANARH